MKSDKKYEQGYPYPMSPMGGMNPMMNPMMMNPMMMNPMMMYYMMYTMNMMQQMMNPMYMMGGNIPYLNPLTDEEE